MRNVLRIFLMMAAVPLLVPASANGQTFASVGTRAAGMGGAFVGVADDASAIYWNPAGLAAGSYFSLVVDGGTAELTPDGLAAGGEDSSFLLGFAMPALGLAYYRLESRVVSPVPALSPAESQLSSRNLSVGAESRLDRLITHHGGLTLVQSLWPGVAVGATLKLVRGIAASSIVPGSSAGDVLDTELQLLGRASNRFDLDVGVMASGGPLKVGVTVRNVVEPEFQTAGDTELVLERQARAGLAYAVTSNWVAAADFDLLRTRDPFGERRDIALGVEGRLGRRALVRSGLAVNTVDLSDDDGASRRAFSVGGSYAVRAAIYVDGHFTTGNDRAGHQWGLAARFVY